MAVVAVESLPLGFRFHPTDEELVNHYLKRKITGRIKSEAQVIPEVDVCKCEPWELPGKSLIQSDDPEWFFFGPRDRKYPNGHRSNRATVAGYWKATGKDRFIRSKASVGKPTVIGMKKTLVFHRGRAPKGIRTCWIMHEYRTTEPEFESGEEGGFVLYRLFKKPEEKIPDSNADEMDRSGFSPTPTKSSPSDTQHEADAMEELTTPSNSVQESPKSDVQEAKQLLPDSVDKQPAGIRRWLADKADCTSTCSVKPDECFGTSASKDHQDTARANVQADNLQDVLGQICDTQYEQKGGNGSAHMSTPMLTYTDHSFFGNNSQAQIGLFPADNADQDSLNEFLNSVLINHDEYSSAALYVQKDSVVETLPTRSIWESASCKDSATSSDIDTETGIIQEPVGLEDPEWLYGSSYLSANSLEMDTSNGYPEIKPHLSALYENVSLLPYDNTGPDVYSVDSSAKSLQDLFDSMEELTSQKNMITSKGDSLEGTGIKIVPREQQHPPISSGQIKQGIAPRRIRLQSSIQMASYSGAESASSCNKNDYDDKEATSKALLDSCDSLVESTNLKNMTSDRDSLEGTGIKIRSRREQCLSVSNNLPGQGTAVRRIRLQNKLEMGSNANMDSESSSNKVGHGEKVASSEAGEHSELDTADESEISGPAHLDKPKDLSSHDETPGLEVMPKPSEETYQESKPSVRSRRRGTDHNENTLEVPPLNASSPRIGSFANSIRLVILPVMLLGLCVGIWRCMSSQYV